MIKTKLMQQLGKVLIIDDDVTSNFLSAFTLRHTNATEQIFEAENGRAALELITKEALDFILLDVNMPIMNGLEFLEALKNLCKTTSFTPPIIVLLTTSESYLDCDSVTQYPMVRGSLTKPLMHDHIPYLASLLGGER
jgi:CheY-like chemotaxis protein